MLKRVLWTAVLLAASALRSWGFSVDDVAPRIRELQSSRYVLAASAGLSAQGRQILYLVVTDPRIDHREKMRVMILAGQHGNEMASIDGVLRTVHYLAFDGGERARSLRQRVLFIVVPLMNPDGAAAGSRTSAVGKDLNRDWIDPSQPEVYAVSELMDLWKPELLLDEHQWLDGDGGVSDFIETSSAAAAGIRDDALKDRALRHVKAVNNTPAANPALAHRHFASQGIISFLIESRQGQGRDYKPQFYQQITLGLVDSSLARRKPEGFRPGGWAVPALLGEQGASARPPVVKHPWAVFAAFVFLCCYLLLLASVKFQAGTGGSGRRPRRRRGGGLPRREHDHTYRMSRPRPRARGMSGRHTAVM